MSYISHDTTLFAHSYGIWLMVTGLETFVLTTEFCSAFPYDRPRDRCFFIFTFLLTRKITVDFIYAFLLACEGCKREPWERL